MANGFKITKRHYDTLIDQALKNYPEETGGFLGGEDRYIKAILPIFNQHLYNKTDTFSYTPEDALRAREFFEKHGLQYFGVYHTHPKGAAVPSKQDLSHIQQHMFIISLRNIKAPDFAAFDVNGKHAMRVPLKIVTSAVEVKDIHGGDSKKPNLDAISPAVGDMTQEAQRLGEMIGAYLQDEHIHYPKYQSDNPWDSDFNTVA